MPPSQLQKGFSLRMCLATEAASHQVLMKKVRAWGWQIKCFESCSPAQQSQHLQIVHALHLSGLPSLCLEAAPCCSSHCLKGWQAWELQHISCPHGHVGRVPDVCTARMRLRFKQVQKAFEEFLISRAGGLGLHHMLFVGLLAVLSCNVATNFHI